MDQELQFLISNLYGNKLSETQLSKIIQAWNNSDQYKESMRNAQGQKSPNVGMLKIRNASNNFAETNTPTLGTNTFKFNKNAGKAKNDMSAIDDFRQAFRQARQGDHETFFWKKTKANPSGMFSTELAEKQPTRPAQVTAQIDQNKVDALMPKTPTIGGNSFKFNKQAAIDQDEKVENYIAKINPHLGGTMRPWLQQGGSVNDTESMINSIIEGINQNDPRIQEIFQKLGEEGTQQVLQLIQQKAQSGNSAAQQAIAKITGKTQVAKLGAKLKYVQGLKGICPEGTEKVYLKNGGCMCAQKALGGASIEENKNNKKNSKSSKKLDPKTTKNLPGGKYPSNWNSNDRMTWERTHGSNDEGAHVVKNKGVGKNACGAKMKKNK